MRTLSLAAAILVAASVCLAPHTAQASTDPVKVILLSGQSNMVGHGKSEFGLNPNYDYSLSQAENTANGNVREIQTYYDTNTNQWVGQGSLRYMVGTNPGVFGPNGTNPLVGPDINGIPGSGDWLVRDDVFIHKQTDGNIRTGGHTIGFGKNNNWVGPEYGLGQVVGNALDEDVVIIKVAWGGKSLDEDFRSPTAATRRGLSVGTYWTDMVTDMNAAIGNLNTLFPQFAGREFDISGFGWHQGWNDRINSDSTARYEDNMADFINDVRAEFGSDLPFIIANTGIEPGQAATDAIIAAQNAMADFGKYPDHEGNVAVVDTTGMYRAREESPTGFNFHWNHNGPAHYEIGAGMGEAYLALVPEPSSLLLLGAGGLLLTQRRRRSAA